MWKLLPIVFLTSIAVAQAQTPNAGSLLHDLLNDGELFNLPEVEAKPAPALPTEMPDIPGLRVAVNAFDVRGATQFDTALLVKLIQGRVGPELSIEDLRAAANEIASFYRDQGWVARVFLPRQDITLGTVIIQVQESQMGSVMYNTDPSLVNRSVIDDMFGRALPAGEPVNLDRLDRVLRLADDMPGVSLTGALQPGVEEGQTDLLVEIEDEVARRGSIGFGNSGSYSTGRNSLSMSLYDSSPFQRGGLVSISLSSAAGSKYVRGGYSGPVGSNGLTLGGAASIMRYTVDKGAAASLDANGGSTSLELTARYPINRSVQQNLYLNGQATRTGFVNRASGSVTSDYHKWAYRLGVNGNQFDSFGGGGVTAYALNFRRSVLGGNRGTNASVLASHYNFWDAELTRNQTVSDQVSAFTKLRRQHARAAIDSSDNLSVGGLSGVRAYPTGEGSAAQADQANLELRWNLRDGPLLTAFYDWARVRDRDVNVGHYLLRGYGVSVDVSLPVGLDLSATWANPIGAHPNPANGDPGLNQDGTAFGSRVWLSLTYPF